MDLASIFNQVISHLVAGIVVLFAFGSGRFVCEYNHGAKVKSIFQVLGGILLLTLVMWGNYGTHREDADPIYGGGEIVYDFEPTERQRNDYGIEIFLTLTIPAVIGIYHARPDHYVLEPET